MCCRPALFHCFFPFARHRPLRRSPTPLWWDRASYGPLAKNPTRMPRKSFVPGNFPFFVYLLLKSRLLLTIAISAVKPGVNVLSKQPTMAEKWRHSPGLPPRARWTLPLFCSGPAGWAAVLDGQTVPRRGCPTVWSPAPAGRRRDAP